MTDLAAHPQPVLGCSLNSGAKNHAFLPCLGYLGHPELMLLLALVFPEGIQCDLTQCSACPNNDMRDSITVTHALTARLLPDNKIRLVNEERDLDYRPTGALDSDEKERQTPSFNSRFCVNCGSCAAFCRNEGLRLTHNKPDAA